MKKEIVLSFSTITGECEVEAVGFKGKSCEQATKFLKDTLGKMTDFKRKTEWYEENLKAHGYIKSNLCG